MARQAPRIGLPLLAALERLDDPRVPIAEVHRRLAAVAEHLGLTRPSYEQTRVLVHQLRRDRSLAPDVAGVLLDVAMRSRPPSALEDLVVEVLSPRPQTAWRERVEGR